VIQWQLLFLGDGKDKGACTQALVYSMGRLGQSIVPHHMDLGGRARSGNHEHTKTPIAVSVLFVKMITTEAEQQDELCALSLFYQAYMS
jgi:hypothetical protein